jgi:pyruvate/2-oxoglutarate dehydrogenase complex dihydrolipoamide acyltransferase (E2) component
MCLAKVVKHVPLVNSSLIDGQVKIWEDINVAVAIALDMGPYESGLITPVIKNADQKSLTAIGRSTRELVKKAKSGGLSIEDMSGGTITLSNVGAYAPGWTISTPILNLPQAFIVQPGAIVDRVVAVNGEMAVRPIMSVSVTFDHRIMDGVPPLKWLTKFKELLERPSFLLL